MRAHLGVAHLSDSLCGENVLSLVSFLAALLHLPPLSDSGLVVMENSVETKCSLRSLLFWVLSVRPGPGSGGFGLFLFIGWLSYKLGLTSGNVPELEIGFPRNF